MASQGKPMASAPTIVWLRQDLRLADNPALQAAIEAGGEVIPVYIHDIKSEGHWAPGGATLWWLHYALIDLSEQFSKTGASLIIRSGDSLEELRNLVKESRSYSSRLESSLRTVNRRTRYQNKNGPAECRT